MNKQQSIKRDQYYTKDHEWIDFKGKVAYIGICKFKLTGFKQIQEIKFNEIGGIKKQGEVIATIKYNDYQIDVHMPVDGEVIQVNEKLVSESPNMLLDCAEGSGWVALIIPLLPLERKDLLLPKQYHTKW